tara:strand:- start:327 stop:551 length:225 start_codon:yes stop_codon:yes gene_type:complete
MINPKMKTPMEIPSFCNFFIYSNESDTLYLREDSRRYYIVDIPHPQKLIIEKLENDCAEKLAPRVRIPPFPSLK